MFDYNLLGNVNYLETFHGYEFDELMSLGEEGISALRYEWDHIYADFIDGY